MEVREPSVKYLAKVEGKQPAGGCIPEDWTIVSVGDLASFSSGSGIRVSSLDGESSESSVPVFGGNGIAGFTNRILVHEPTVVIGRVGQRCGEVYLSSGPAWITDNALYPRLRHREFDTNFLARALGGAALNDVKNRNDLPLVTQTILHAVRIAWPSNIDEQRAIAAALSDIDALLSGLDRLIAKKRDLKQAAMQQLLTGKTRLPGFVGEWRVGTFGDVVASLDAGVSVNSTDTTPSNDVPCVLKTSALVGGDFLSAEVKVIETHDVPRARTNPKRDTILISRMNTPMLVGEVAYVDQDYDWIFLPDRVWMARFNPVFKVCARWLAFVLSSRTYRDMLREVATGTSGSMKNISKGALLPLPINFPSAEEQIAIASVLADMDAELEALEARRDKTRALKQGMMQELLTGRTRLV